MTDHIFPRLISRKAAIHLPIEAVTISFFDLVVFFVYTLRQGYGFVDSTCITKRLLGSAHLSVDDLLTIAVSNLRNLRHPQIERIEDVVPLPFPEDPQHEITPTFYVLSTGDRFYGASLMLCDDILEQFADSIGESFNIIPSSVHEVLLVPDSIGLSVVDLHEMLLEVNRTMLAPEEILSDSIYHYDIHNGLYVVRILNSN